MQELIEALQAAESQLHGVQTERDALLTAVRELQRAMLDARGRGRSQSIANRSLLSGTDTCALYQTIEERSGQLQLLESRLTSG
jgi:hypothetical protein